MPNPSDIPFSKMLEISDSGVFIKRFSQYGQVTMKTHAHRDDYYMVVLLSDGEATVEVDFEKMRLKNGDILIVSPWQVHNKPKGESWEASGWIIALTPEIFSESETERLEKYSILPRPFCPGNDKVNDITVLYQMLERNKDNKSIFVSLASAIKSIVLSALDKSETDISDRYKAITMRFKKLIYKHLSQKKSPSAYAAMMNISEVYLNEAVKGATGLSAGAYIRHMVIIKARRQLAYSTLSSKEIAYSLGYNDYAYFSKLFRKTVGMSPSDYRKNLK